MSAFLFITQPSGTFSVKIREERELCCDDMVVAAGDRDNGIARSLLQVATLESEDPLSNIAVVRLAATGNMSSLRHRYYA